MTSHPAHHHDNGTTTPWLRAAAGARLLGASGAPAPTIFEEMTALAQAHGALNLGQGFPDDEPPQTLREIAAAGIAAGANQYAPGSGILPLREAIAAHQERFYGLTLSPATDVVVTTGATEAIAATLLAFCTPGSNVVVLEPFYDSYGAIARLAGAELHPVPLHAPDFQPRLEDLEAAVDENTAVIIVNDPHNPTGTRFTEATRRALVAAAQRSGAVLLADEVYEHLVFEGEHRPLATVAGAFERTVTVSSGGKTFSATGWKIGWATGPSDLISAVRTVKQFLSYSSGPAYQPAIAEGLGLPESFFRERAASLAARASLLGDGLESTGATVFRPQAGYFVVADLAPLGIADATALARRLPEALGVVGIPVGVFATPPHEDQYSSMLRLAHCKREDVIVQATQRLRDGLPALAPQAQDSQR
ncbi:aminotransferase class I/II-fold pyridoxal phosphate-dependent enzyme [Galactobacter valiniphilus]|uniref:aminotransferase class I/II-fold pyridoxal phosphate-dependent enzyme n=1 Tax=Galactobacter valiniphilus TaxID=2676122 RepID=UPI003735EF02